MTRTSPHLLTLILLTALSVASLNMFLPSLANIAADFGVDYALVSFSVAGFLGATALVHLTAGPLADRYGRRPVILVAMTVFVFASAICSIADNIWIFLTFRTIQSAVAAGAALSLAIVRDTTSKEKSAGLIGYMSMVMALAPMLGPVLGGFLDAGFGWRSNFYLYTGCGVMLLAICWFDLGETRPKNTKAARSGAGNLLVLLKTSTFLAYAFCTAFSTGAFFIFLAGAPFVAAETFGVGTAKLGIYIGSITAGFMLGSFLAGKFAPRYHLTTMMIAGRVVACLGLGVGLIIFLAGVHSAWLFFGSTIFVGIGNGVTMPGSNTGAISARDGMAGSAAGLNAALNVGSGAVLTSLTGFALGIGNPPAVLLILMLGSSFAGLLAALWARRLDSGENDVLHVG
ncbi:MAG: Bcr/CflA family efflux MFS transporter [Boseongicola sp.]|nr:MAG: Bcr/CflA family efflux MFS transporter [Boseongicola sp.]